MTLPRRKPHGMDGPDDTTQPMDTQVWERSGYHRYTEHDDDDGDHDEPAHDAIAGDVAPQDHTYPTGDSGHVHFDTLCRTSPAPSSAPAQQLRSDPDSEDELAATTTQLRSDDVTSPAMPSPYTPALASLKRDRAGHLLSSAVRAPPPDLSNVLHAKPHAPAMGLTQLFAQTQGTSSPAAPNITPGQILDRPSPEFDSQRRTPRSAESPTSTRRAGLAEAGARATYISKQASQERRNQRLGRQQHMVDNDDDDDGLGEDAEWRAAAKRRRRHAELEATRRDMHQTFQKPVVPSTVTKKRKLAETITPAGKERASTHVDLVDDTPQHHLAAGGRLDEVDSDEGGNSRDKEDDDEQDEEQDDAENDQSASNDEYDELSQTIVPRSDLGSRNKTPSSSAKRPASFNDNLRSRSSPVPFYRHTRQPQRSALHRHDSDMERIADSQPELSQQQLSRPQYPKLPESVNSRKVMSQSQPASLSSTTKALLDETPQVAATSSPPPGPPESIENDESRQVHRDRPNGSSLEGANNMQLDSSNDNNIVSSPPEPGPVLEPARAQQGIFGQQSPAFRRMADFVSQPDAPPSPAFNFDFLAAGDADFNRAVYQHSPQRTTPQRRVSRHLRDTAVVSNVIASPGDNFCTPTSADKGQRSQENTGSQRSAGLRRSIPPSPNTQDTYEPCSPAPLHSQSFMPKRLRGSGVPRAASRLAAIVSSSPSKASSPARPAGEELVYQTGDGEQDEEDEDETEHEDDEVPAADDEATTTNDSAHINDPKRHRHSNERLIEDEDEDEDELSMAEPKAAAPDHGPEHEPLDMGISKSDDEEGDLDTAESSPLSSAPSYVGRDEVDGADELDETDETDDTEGADEAGESKATARVSNTPAVGLPTRVLARFRGSANWYPATCRGSAPNEPSKLRLLFDDTNELDVEYWLCCPLELRANDMVKVDTRETRKHTWVVKAVSKAARSSPRLSFPDIHGNTMVTVEKRQKTPDEPVEQMTVPITYIYLTSSMWKHYKPRSFASAASMPESVAQRPETPSMVESNVTTPSSRTRRPAGLLAPAPTKQHGMFAHMVFPLSFAKRNDAVKSRVKKAVIQHGGTVLALGFEELFEVPQEREDVASAANLRLRAKFRDAGFAALICDDCTRKTKYVQALALNLPCLHYNWIEHTIAQGQPAPWLHYLLPAGRSDTLAGELRSRTFPSPADYARDVATARLATMVDGRAQLLEGQGVLILTQGLNPLQRKAHLFLAHALGALKTQRVSTVPATREALDGDASWNWVCVDKKSLPRIKRELQRTSQLPAHVTVVDDEFVIQSLILGALVRV